MTAGHGKHLLCFGSQLQRGGRVADQGLYCGPSPGSDANVGQVTSPLQTLTFFSET